MLKNYYQAVSKDQTIKYKQNDNTFALQHPARVVINGPSGCGKTTLMMNLLLNEDVKIPFDRIYLFARHVGVDGEPLYNILIEHCKDVEAKIEKKTKEVHKILHHSDSLDLPPFESLPKDMQICIIIDDFMNEGANALKVVSDFYIACRKYNCSIFFLSQRYTPVPRTIRLNSNYCILFDTPDRCEISKYHNDMAGELDSETFKSMFYSVMKAPLQTGQVRHSLLIDKNNQNLDDLTKPTKYRMDITRPLIPSEYQ